jgi:(p)ppGpp synthase/HD superfamily hydrolase
MPEAKLKPRFIPTARLVAAFEYACRLHANQARKGTTIPYVSHLMAVAALVIEHGGGEDEAIAALLHDAIEDQNHDGSVPAEIGARFGPRVQALVEACSDSGGPAKGPWRARKEAYLDHVSHAASDVRLISAADKLHNARAILADYRRLGDELWARFNASHEDQLWYYRGLVTALRHADVGDRSRSLVDELNEVVTALEREVRAATESPRKGR